MDQVNTLRRAGLFDAKVPRYTSYPPANRFGTGVGALRQRDWLARVPAKKPVSIYIHIPFCRRLCWFCACRTQGTKTLGPVGAYVEALVKEIEAVTQDHLPPGVKMQRLHLGGGTPTLLNAALMDRLLQHIHKRFPLADGFEFSVEIDPTEAADEVLEVLADYNMTRASIGVQDFDPKVQDAIGRRQSLATTENVASLLRKRGVESLNIDFLYGLPFQSARSLVQTIDRIVSLQPDRLALYGYAHVPHVSKRQVMIPGDALPNGESRFVMSQIARERLLSLGYLEIGIDHFALPPDSLARAANLGTLSRNFQGYTDDPCETLIGFGASSISKFAHGYVQNAVATSAYNQRIATDGVAGDKGIVLTSSDQFVAALLDGIMCYGAVHFVDIKQRFPDRSAGLHRIVDDLISTFPELVELDAQKLSIRSGLMASARLIAARLDHTGVVPNHHSIAV